MRKAGRVWSAAGCVALGALMVGAQNAPKPEFEVAAIRAATYPTPDTFRNGQFKAGMRIDGASLDFEFVSLADLLPYAYRVKNYQVAGPEWMRETRWDVIAKLPAGAPEDQAPEMMQALLADRFKLAVHHEKRDQPVYELVVAKGGPKMEVSTDDGKAAAPPASAAPADGNGRGGGPGFFIGGGPLGGGPFGIGGGSQVTITQGGPGGRGGATISGGANGTTQITPSGNCGMHLEFSKMTMQGLADTLSPFLDKPVLNGTGLTGAYKASLNLPLEVMFAMMQNQIRSAGLPPPGQFGPGGGPGGGGPPPGGPGGPGGRGPDGGPMAGMLAGCADPAALFAGGADVSNAALFQAVQQLGLRLEAKKAPFDTIVVDHLEKNPTEN